MVFEINSTDRLTLYLKNIQINFALEPFQVIVQLPHIFCHCTICSIFRALHMRLTKLVSPLFHFSIIFIITTFNLKFIQNICITKLCSQWGLFRFYDRSGRFFILKYVRSIMYLGPKYVHLTSSFVSGERKMLIYKPQPPPGRPSCV